jgi:hypothetical protein
MRRLKLPGIGPTLPGQFMTDLEAEGLILRMYASDAELQAAVETGDELVGVMLPEDFVQQIRSGEKPRATLYVNSQIPEEFRTVYNLLIEEMSYFYAGQTLNIETEEVVGTRHGRTADSAPRPDGADAGCLSADG